MALPYLERNTFGKDTRTWAHCDRKELLIVRSKQGGEQNHQALKTILRARFPFSTGNGNCRGKKYRRPLNENIASMIDPHMLGALPCTMEVKRRMQLDVRRPSTLELEAAERYDALESQFKVLQHIVWRHDLAFIPSIEYIKKSLNGAREVVFKGRKEVPIVGSFFPSTIWDADNNPREEATFLQVLPNALEFATQVSIEAKQIEEVEGYIKRTIHDEASTIFSRKHLQPPRIKNDIDVFKKRIRKWQCCGEFDGQEF